MPCLVACIPTFDVLYRSRSLSPALSFSRRQMYGVKGHCFVNLGNNMAVRPKKNGKSGYPSLNFLPPLLLLPNTPQFRGD